MIFLAIYLHLMKTLNFRLKMDLIKDSKILVVGGAGFVGSNLVHYLLENHDPKEICIVDNLLSSDLSNVPNEKKVKFILGSIADYGVLSKLPLDLNVIFHLSCFHGNQSSIADPLADHENNTITSLKLFEYLKDFKDLKKVVYAAAGCAVAEKTFDDASATTEDAPVSLFHDSPYSISKLIGKCMVIIIGIVMVSLLLRHVFKMFMVLEKFLEQEVGGEPRILFGEMLFLPLFGSH